MRHFIAIILLATSLTATAQSKATNALEAKYSSRTFFFYNNTLRMVNISEDKDFDELIKDIERMKLVYIVKKEKNFTNEAFKKLMSDYKTDSFEEIMTSRHEGRNFNVLVKEKEGKTKGMLVTVNDTESVYVLDIVGSIQLNNVTKFFNKLDKSSDISEQIKSIANKSNDKADN